jgi:hypothetical protein
VNRRIKLVVLISVQIRDSYFFKRDLFISKGEVVCVCVCNIFIVGQKSRIL